MIWSSAKNDAKQQPGGQLVPDNKMRDHNAEDAATMFAQADMRCAFGPSFFLGNLGRFVREHCPESKENLPLVRVYVAGGETLDVCHIIGVSPRWVMLAVRDLGNQRDAMAVELVPYEAIHRVSIRSQNVDSRSMGFSEIRRPQIIGPETLVRAAMLPDHGGGT